MRISTAEAKNRLPELLHDAERGEEIIITRHGRPVARLGPVPAEPGEVQLGTMKGRVHFLPGWDQPITEDELLGKRS